MRIRSALPKGGSLPPDEWRRRHRALLGILWLNAAVLPAYGLLTGHYGALHDVAHGAALVVLAAAASSALFAPRYRSVFASLGLLSAAALLVHLTGGLIEAHFYFFVVIVAMTLYEAWLPFLLAVGYVLLHHGIVGTLEPHEVYNRPDAWAHPWLWAGIHAFFVALAGAAAIIAWRLNENVRNKMRATQKELATLSETDSLTGLPNRRKAMADLAEVVKAPEPTLLALFDLNGFKSYNDTFGHLAGDSLLARLGQRMVAAIGAGATVYRLGGDEFCLLGPVAKGGRAALEARAAALLSEQGEGFSVTAAYGSVLIPAEAATPTDAMRLADQRMYARKHSSRPSAVRQSKDVLLQTLAERNLELGAHVSRVGELVDAVARRMGMADHEIQVLQHAAELHDVGKVAIPDAILNKPGPLDEAEWEYVRRHTVIGQRIVAAAPALAGVGEVIRSCHERWDGDGYPDGHSGEQILLAARIIAVCDAYEAMTADRPYRRALSEADALAELRRCAGSQFDPQVVSAFEAVIADGELDPAVSMISTNGSPVRAARPA